MRLRCIASSFNGLTGLMQSICTPQSRSRSFAPLLWLFIRAKMPTFGLTSALQRMIHSSLVSYDYSINLEVLDPLYGHLRIAFKPEPWRKMTLTFTFTTSTLQFARPGTFLRGVDSCH